MRDVRVVLIGAGTIAREHAKAFADVPNATLAGIHSRTRAKAETLAADFGIGAVCDSVEELYARTQADLAVVAVNAAEMKHVSELVFRRPWTVLLEKPAGLDLAEAEQVAAAAEGRGAGTYVALNRRMYSSTRTVLGDIDARDERRYVHVLDQEDPLAGAAAGHPPAVVANWMFANSIHVIDYIRMFCRGAIASVTPVVGWSADAPDVVVTKVAFESGDTAIYEGIWNGPAPWMITVQTRSRRWEMRPVERAQFQNRGERKVNEVAPHEWDIQFKPGFRRQAEQAVAAARGETNELATIGDALETMRLVADIFGKRTA
jgi:predicted dehydrogenase